MDFNFLKSQLIDFTQTNCKTASNWHMIALIYIGKYMGVECDQMDRAACGTKGPTSWYSATVLGIYKSVLCTPYINY